MMLCIARRPAHLSRSETRNGLQALRGPRPDETVSNLCAILVSALRHALARRSGLDQGALQDFVEEALLKTLAAPDSFRGESSFTSPAKQGALSHAPPGW
jgi:hypothetical protein